MLQTVLMFLAPPDNPAGAEKRLEKRLEKRSVPMATRARPGASTGWDEAGIAGSSQNQGECVVSWLAVVGNALGFSLLIAGIWLVLRLAEFVLA
jgi:hypothetical protein